MGESNTYTEWMQAELIARLNAPREVTQLLPIPFLEVLERKTTESSLPTLPTLRKTNTVPSSPAQLPTESISLLLKPPSSSEEREAAGVDLAVYRVQAVASKAAIANLEEILGLYRDRIRIIGNSDPGRGNFGLEGQITSLEFSPLVGQIAHHSSRLDHLLRLSDSTLSTLMLRCPAIPSETKNEISTLRAELAVLGSDSKSVLRYTAQEAIDQLGIWLERVTTREDLLRRYELVKQDLIVNLQEWPLASIFAGQKEAAFQLIKNIHKSQCGNPEEKSVFEDLEKSIRELVHSEEPRPDLSLALQQHLVALADLQYRLLAAETSHISLPHDISATTVTEELQVSFQSMETSDPKLLLEEEMQVRLNGVLELSEKSLTVLADLAISDPFPIQQLRENRGQACGLQALVSLEEEHQKLRMQFLGEIPNLLVTAGLLKSMLEEVKTLRCDLREKLSKTQQTAALEEMAKSDSLEVEAFEALNSLFHSTSNSTKERLLYTVHERLTLLISRHRSLQGAGFLPPDQSARTELDSSWKRLLTLINDQISLVTETYHKLTVDGVDTKAKLETLLEDRKPGLTEVPAFSIGFDYLAELIAAVREMIEHTDNLTDVIREIRAVDSSLRQCELTMQENYYKLKPVVGVEDGRKRERKRTFITITHAEPLTPKEGIYILTDIIAALKKNANNLFEIENKRVQVIENSLNLKRAREALELLHEVADAERVLRLDSANQLLAAPGAGEEARQASLLAQGLSPCQSAIPALSDSITAFLTEVLPWLQESLAYDQALNRLIRKTALYLD